MHFVEMVGLIVLIVRYVEPLNINQTKINNSILKIKKFDSLEIKKKSSILNFKVASR